MALYEPIIGYISGRLGGLQFTKTGVVGVASFSSQPPTSEQLNVQRVFRSLQTRYAQSSVAVRTAWSAYAQNWTGYDRWGTPRPRSGASAYVGCNLPLTLYEYATGAVTDMPPLTYPIPNFFDMYPQDASSSVGISTASEWIGFAGNMAAGGSAAGGEQPMALEVALSPPLTTNADITKVKYTVNQYISITTATGETDWTDWPIVCPVNERRYGVRLRTLDVTGRYSVPLFFEGTSATVPATP